VQNQAKNGEGGEEVEKQLSFQALWMTQAACHVFVTDPLIMYWKTQANSCCFQN
jgi:hypothetical protein